MCVCVCVCVFACSITTLGLLAHKLPAVAHVCMLSSDPIRKEPLIPPSEIAGISIDEHAITSMLAARPPPVRRLLTILVQHLARIADMAAVNKMTPSNLGE